jgi:nickel-type superoxide dismutase maturation protease
MSEQRYHGRRGAILPALVLAITAWWWMRRRPFVMVVEGESMLPTLAPGDFLAATKTSALRRGALVVLSLPDHLDYDMVKRLVAVPGDAEGDRTLGPDQYWVLGDHPEGSTDSRQFGSIPSEVISGVVRLRYWPPWRARWF